MNTVEAATRLMERPPGALERRGAMVLAAAGAIAGPLVRPGLSPAASFMIHAGAATVHPVPKSVLRDLGAEIPSNERLDCLAAAEPLLALLDARWAWEFMQDLVGAEQTIRAAALGLDIASHLDEDTVLELFSDKCRLNSMFAEQLAVEGAARARQKPCLEARNVKPFAAGPYLAAAAFTGASEGLRAAHELLEWLSPDVLQEGLCLVAEAAVHQGCAPAIARLAAGESDITVQAAWVEAAARSHAVEPGTLISLIRELGPRVTGELDPGRHLLAGLPLLAALAAAGSDEDLARLGVEWRVPPPLLADQLFYRGLAAGPAVFERLLDVPEPAWDDLFEYDFCWWKPVSRDPAARVQACANVVAIGANLPWRPMPGSLKDLVHWP